MNIKKIMALFAAITVLFVLPGCGNLIEKTEGPGPSPGVHTSPASPNGVSNVSYVLYKSGSVYNADYTAEYDGFRLVEVPLLRRKDSSGNIIPGGPFTSPGAKVKAGGGVKAGGAPVWEWSTARGANIGGEYPIRGESAMEFRHNEYGNYTETWEFTLFDNVGNVAGAGTPLVGNTWATITLWARVAGYMPGVDIGNERNAPTISVEALSSSGFSYGSGSAIIKKGSEASAVLSSDLTLDPIVNQEWYKYTISLDGGATNVEGTNVIPATDWIKRWTISVPANAGLIYIDEVIIATK